MVKPDLVPLDMEQLRAQALESPTNAHRLSHAKVKCLHQLVDVLHHVFLHMAKHLLPRILKQLQEPDHMCKHSLWHQPSQIQNRSDTRAVSRQTTNNDHPNQLVSTISNKMQMQYLKCVSSQLVSINEEKAQPSLPIILTQVRRDQP